MAHWFFTIAFVSRQKSFRQFLLSRKKFEHDEDLIIIIMAH